MKARSGVLGLNVTNAHLGFWRHRLLLPGVRLFWEKCPRLFAPLNCGRVCTTCKDFLFCHSFLDKYKIAFAYLIVPYYVE